MILDSSFLVDVLRGEATVRERVERVDERGTPAVSTITVMELAEGVHLSDASESEREAVERLLTDLTELPFDRQCALRAGRINASLVAAGEPIDETDVMIGATALVYGHPVVTRDRSHFDRIDDLDVFSY